MRFFTRFLCISFCLSSLLTPLPTHAQDMPLVSKPAIVPVLDNTSKQTKQDFMAATQPISRTPDADPYLSYTIRIPTGWTEVGKQISEEIQEGGLSNRLLTPISRYVSPPYGGEKRSELRVSAVQLDYFISAEHWFLAYILAQKWTLLGMKVVNANRVEAAYQMVNGSDETVVRAVMQVNGARLVLVEYMVPLSRSVAEKDIEIGTLQSFALTLPDNSLPEPVSERAMFDIAKFLFPASWNIASPPIRTDEEMRTTLVLTAQDIDNPATDEIEVDYATLKGRIEVIGRRRVGEYNEAGFTSWLSDLMKAKGNVSWVDKLPEQPKAFKISDTLQFDGLAVYPMVDAYGRPRPQEIWLLLAHTPRYDYAVVLATPGRTTDYGSWARNISAFELIGRSLKHTGKETQ